MPIAFSSKTVNFILKPLLAIGLLALLYIQLTRQNDLQSMWALFAQNLDAGKKNWLLATFALLPLNWLFETLKWQPLMAKYQNMGVWRGFQAVMAGVSFSIFTPNRVGEYGGRILFVEPEQRWKSLIINIIGNFGQIIVISGFGLIGLLWFYQTSEHFNSTLFATAIAFAVVGMVVLLIAYFNIDIFIPLARRIPFLHRFKRYLKDVVLLRQFTRQELGGILFWSIMRFGVYSMQYVFVLKFYQIEGSWIDLFKAVFTIFILQTGIPLPPVLGLVARGSVAVHIFQYFHALPIAALAATFTLWVINLILPALIGIFFILNLNIARIFGYDRT